MKKADFDGIVNSAMKDWPEVVKGVLLEVGCTKIEEVSFEERHIVVSFIERRLPEDNFSIHRNSFEDDYGYLKRGSFDQEGYGTVKEKFGYEERG